MSKDGKRVADNNERLTYLCLSDPPSLDQDQRLNFYSLDYGILQLCESRKLKRNDKQRRSPPVFLIITRPNNSCLTKLYYMSRQRLSVVTV